MLRDLSKDTAKLGDFKPNFSEAYNLSDFGLISASAINCQGE